MIDHWLRLGNMVSWFVCLAVLSPAVWRLLMRRSQYLDPFLAVVFLLAVNRLSFLFRVSTPMSHLTAMLLALVLTAFAYSYQRYDKGMRR